jgi:hypothetical protein
LRNGLFAACLAAAPIMGSGHVSAQTIKDDFTTDEISARNWFVCRRPENAFKIVQAEGARFRAVEMTVHPREDLRVFALLLAHPGCKTDGGVFEPEKNDERAELWEADDVRLGLGTEVWYRFSFFVDPDLPASAERLVIGQWKQNNSATGDSPVIAQRFNGRAFSITVEQDNTAPDRARDDRQCRIWIAVDRNAVKPPGGSEGHSMMLAGPGRPEASTPPAELPSIGHDELDVSHGPTARIDGHETPAPCRRDVEVSTLGFLPDAFGRWVTMLYHIHLDGASSLVEVWADGQPVATVKGRIGFAASGPGKQYFKFGPYRKHQTYSSYARLAHYARGFRRQDVEP